MRGASILALLAGIGVVYAQTLWFPFVEWDDTFYVVKNPTVKAGLSWSGVAWAFTTNQLSNWHPLTWLSLQLDAQCFGPTASGFHATNVLLHGIDTLLVLVVLWRATGRWAPSWLVAALFAVHPLHVESVAWISERKGLLSTLFGLLAIWAYLGYVRRGGAGRYLLVAASFAASLLAKPMLVTLPALLLLLDFWPLARLTQARAWTLVREKLPLLALSGASIVVSFFAQQAGGALRPGEALALSDRIVNAVVALVWYLEKLVWPQGLAALYTHPYLPGGTPWSPAVITASAALLVAVSVAAFRARRWPYLLMGWLWYLISLVPTLGILQLGFQPFADRYSYVPSIGIFIALAWALSDGLDALGASRVSRWAASAVVGCALLALGAAAHAQVASWKDSFALFDQVLRVSPEDPVAHFKLGNLYRDQRTPELAMKHYREAVRIHPGFMKAQLGIGYMLLLLHQVEASIPHFLEAAKSPYSEGKAHRYLGFVYYKLGRASDSISYFREAVRMDPKDARSWNALAIVLEETGAADEAAEAHRKAAALDAKFRAPEEGPDAGNGPPAE
jgi:tetratricopeptide (TPR) repeat protein